MVNDSAVSAASASAAERLWNAVQELGVAFGVEHSVRLCRRAVLADRFLMSLSLREVLEWRAGDLASLIAQLDPPNAVRPTLERLLAKGAYIHFGYEHTGAADLYKVYVELPDVGDWGPAAAGRHVRFWSVKWQVDRPECYVACQYAQRPFASFAALRQLIERTFGNSFADTPARRFSLSVIEVLAQAAAIADLSLLEVTEEGNARRSYDLNVARRDLEVRHLAAHLSDLFRNYAIPECELPRFLETIGTMSLGHIAAGTHRGGEDFVSLYYGAAAGNV